MVERVIDWYNDEMPLEGPPRIASEVATLSKERTKFSSPAAGPVRQVVCTETQRLWSQTQAGSRTLVVLDHHIEGDYYVDKNGGMGVLLDIPI